MNPGRYLCAALVLAVLPLSAQVKITRPNAGRIAVAIDGKPYTDFYLAPDGNKPYFYPLRTASGIIVTRHYPMEEVEGETHDHPHHRGLFFAHGSVNGTDFWATEPDSKDPRKGRMALQRIVQLKSGKKSGTIEAVFEGFDSAGKPLMTETRTIIFYSDPELRIIDYEISIESSHRLTFGDTKEGTFGIRLATDLSEDRTGKMVNAEGQATEKNVWGKRSPWVDYSGKVDGKPVGVAIMDNPSNPRYPTYWHSRAYGLFAANPFGVKEFTRDNSQNGSLTIEPGQRLRFRYRVVIHPGDARSAKIASLYQKYLAESGFTRARSTM
jgi:hypothetical protein